MTYLTILVRLTKKDDRTTIVEGVKVESNRTDKLVKPPSSSNEKACPLCRLNLRRLTYTVSEYISIEIII